MFGFKMQVCEEGSPRHSSSQKSQSSQAQSSQSSKKSSEQKSRDDLSEMITPFTSPISAKIFLSYDTKRAHTRTFQKQESPLEQQDHTQEMKGTVFREFTIHIFQSIHFLQTLQIDSKAIDERAVTLEFVKPHTRKVILFDLDETLAHCVRHKSQIKEPDVYLNVPTPSGKLLEVGFNIRPHC